MIGSLLLKLGMLALTAAVVVWVGWVKRSDVPGASRELPTKEITSGVPNLPPAPAGSAGMPTAMVVEAGPKGVGATRPGASPAGRPESKLDLNRATTAEFERLPGIGPVLAKTVWEDRERRGPFRTVDDLKRVKGIGGKRLDRLRPLVMVRDSGATKVTTR
jgi:competence protein ComEA